MKNRLNDLTLSGIKTNVDKIDSLMFEAKLPQLATGGKPLTRLKLVCLGGSQDGRRIDYSTRQISQIDFGYHYGETHFFETYTRSISLDHRTKRTVFNYRGIDMSAPPPGWLARFFIRIGMVQPGELEIPRS